ncbi:MAG: hypothetical protein ABI837_05675, partial [Acidobacteriota bacterium]
RAYRTTNAPTRGTSVQLAARRYFGDGSEYLGLRAGKGSTRDEIRSAADFDALDARDVTLEGRFAVAPRWLLELRAGAGRQEVQGGDHVRHVSLSSGLVYRW